MIPCIPLAHSVTEISTHSEGVFLCPNNRHKRVHSQITETTESHEGEGAIRVDCKWKNVHSTMLGGDPNVQQSLCSSQPSHVLLSGTCLQWQEMDWPTRATTQKSRSTPPNQTYWSFVKSWLFGLWPIKWRMLTTATTWTSLISVSVGDFGVWGLFFSDLMRLCALKSLFSSQCRWWK